MSPQLVAVKDVKGRILIRWLVGVTGRTAQITDKAGAAAVASGYEPRHVVGFPASDVYEWEGPDGAEVIDEPDLAIFTPKFPDLH